MKILQKTNIDFLRWRWHAIGLSALVIASGILVLATRGIPLGIEFAGGSAIIAEFEQLPTDQQVRDALAAHYPGGAENTVVQSYDDPARRRKMIRVPQVGTEAGTALSQASEQVQEALRKANLGNFTVVGTEFVGPTVGRDLTNKALWATGLSLIGILGYIAFRFQFSFALGAVAATIHDLLVTFAFLAFFGYDLTLNVIAALLTITGFSTNDTIVIFDRVRENLRGSRRDALDEVINGAINQTMSRTIITSGTTLLSSIALLLFGGEVLKGFAFTMVIGIITGTYSTVFIAAAIVSLWQRKGGMRAATRAPSAVRGPAGPTGATPAQQPVRKAKPARKARAS
jgi:preprotein translocase subunit SecF